MNIIVRYIIVIWMGFNLPGCSTDLQQDRGQSRVGYPDQESWSPIITLTDEGVKRAYVQAGHLEKYNDKQSILLDEFVTVDFFNSDETHSSVLTASIAEIDEKSSFMRAFGNVIVKSDSGVTLYTDTLAWDNEIELIYTDDLVMVTTTLDDTLYGIGFESDLSMDHWVILNPSGVTGRKYEK